MHTWVLGNHQKSLLSECHTYRTLTDFTFYIFWFTFNHKKTEGWSSSRRVFLQAAGRRKKNGPFTPKLSLITARLSLKAKGFHMLTCPWSAAPGLRTHRTAGGSSWCGCGTDRADSRCCWSGRSLGGIRHTWVHTLRSYIRRFLSWKGNDWINVWQSTSKHTFTPHLQHRCTA